MRENEPTRKFVSGPGRRWRGISGAGAAGSGASGISWLELEAGDPGSTNTVGSNTVGYAPFKATGKRTGPVSGADVATGRWASETPPRLPLFCFFHGAYTEGVMGNSGCLDGGRCTPLCYEVQVIRQRHLFQDPVDHLVNQPEAFFLHEERRLFGESGHPVMQEGVWNTDRSTECQQSGGNAGFI